jgi:hypothetical protein
MASTTEEEKQLSALEIVVLVIAFLGFVATIVNVGFAVADHKNLLRVMKQLQ